MRTQHLFPREQTVVRARARKEWFCWRI